MLNKRHTHTWINPLEHIQTQCPRWEWNQANSEPGIELPFKGSKSTMTAAAAAAAAVMTMIGIKTTATTHRNHSCRENIGTKQQTSGGFLKWLYSCKWKGAGLDRHLAATLAVCLYFCVSVCPVCQTISSACRSAWFILPARCLFDFAPT